MCQIYSKYTIEISITCMKNEWVESDTLNRYVKRRVVFQTAVLHQQFNRSCKKPSELEIEVRFREIIGHSWQMYYNQGNRFGINYH